MLPLPIVWWAALLLAANWQAGMNIVEWMGAFSAAMKKLRVHCPDLWQKLLYMDAHTWRSFRPDYN